MSDNNLSSVLREHGNAVELLRNSRIGMYIYPVVAAEFTNWRSEQAAWRDSAVLFDQTHHMDELIVEGPDAADFLENIGINSFANFDLNRAKHFVPVTPAGHVVGDMIIFRERADKFILVGRAPTANWVKFHQAVGNSKVRLIHDPRSDGRPDGKARLPYPLPLPDPGAGRGKNFRQDQRRPGTSGQVFPCRPDQCGLAARAGAQARHGRRAGT